MAIEFRAYYDEKGDVLSYSCENLEGNYIVIDAQAYAECRPDMRVKDGKLIKKNSLVITKLVQSTIGISCEKEDISIVSSSADSIKWNLKIDER